MKTYNDEDLLGMVELYAEEIGAIASEQELSDRFDEQIAPMVIEQYGENDQPAMDQAFNDWTDGLCKDGEIHAVQYNEYTYVGEYSE